MARQIALFSVAPSRTAGELTVTEVIPSGEVVTLSHSCDVIIPVTLRNEQYLAGYDATSGHLYLHRLTFKSPWLEELPANPELGAAKDVVESFVVGNQPYILAYSAEEGVFELYSVEEDLSVSRPYRFVRNHRPGVTKGFTTIKPFTAQGSVALLGYNGSDGLVAIYALSVTATSPERIPPLLLKNVWAHEWAKGWTRFAMFQFGGANFFLKTNTWRFNVNIDHIFDNLVDGTCEIASHLELKDAQELKLVEPFTLGHGDPYFVTYKDDGQTTLNRFYGDCTGWVEMASFKGPPDASGVIPLKEQNGREVYLVFYLGEGADQ